MHVYFIGCGSKQARVKIGKTNDIQRRMTELQTGCPFPLKLLGSIKCKSERHAFEVEKSAHEVFRRERKCGEWFFVSGEVLRFIKVICDRDADEVKESVWQARYDERERKIARRRGLA